MRKLLLVFVLVASFSVQFPVSVPAQKRQRAAAAAPKARPGADLITADQMRAYLYFIASDEMEGRDTPSRGLDTTAKFLAMNLTRWGFRPAGDNGTFLQKILLSRARIDPDKTAGEFGGRPLKYGEDFLASNVSGTASGQLVYVGHGWVVKDKDIDPYKNLDIKGKVIIYNGGAAPKGLSLQELLSASNAQNVTNPLKYAEEHGAVGAIIIPNLQSLTNWSTLRQNSADRGTLSVAKFTQGNESRLPVITASASLLLRLFQGEHDVNDILAHRLSGDSVDSFALSPGKTISFNVAAKNEEQFTQNVVAVFEGSDPVLKNEYVAVGAHYDHVGVGQPAGGRRPPKQGGDATDVIYNGADDDGSGTTAILSMAEAVSHSPVRPKRSILFVWHCGEEKGLWGSRYFTTYPTIPLDKVVAQLNIDMIGRSKAPNDTKPDNADLSGPNEIYVIGSKMMSTDLGNLSEAVNSSYLNVGFNYKYDDPTDPNRFFFRSDHFNYAKRGIPIIFYFDGVHEDYHRSSDSPDKIDYQKMEKVARTVYATMWELANRPTRPAVDKQLPTQLTGED